MDNLRIHLLGYAFLFVLTLFAIFHAFATKNERDRKPRWLFLWAMIGSALAGLLEASRIRDYPNHQSSLTLLLFYANWAFFVSAAYAVWQVRKKL